jgi:pimeloyl-ACP methyl ester carboxylesterase
MRRTLAANDPSMPPPTHAGGQGSALILLHGLGGTWKIWKPVLAALEARHRVIAMTLPGHHGAPAYDGYGDATVAGLADQVVATLRAQGIERAHVAGYSFGGWLSIELARRRFARSVVAFSPAGGWRSDHDYMVLAKSFKVYALVDVVRFLSAPVARFGWIRKVLARQAMEHAERVPQEEFSAFLRAMSRTKVLPGLLRTMRRDGPVAILEADDIPIRIAWCERDRVIPFRRYGEPFVERIHGAHVTVVPGAGHVPIYDDPGQVIGNILAVTGPVDAAGQITK